MMYLPAILLLSKQVFAYTSNAISLLASVLGMSTVGVFVLRDPDFPVPELQI